MEFFSLNKIPSNGIFEAALARGYKYLLMAKETNLYSAAILGCVTCLIDHDHLKPCTSLWLTKFHKYFDRNPELSSLILGISTSKSISTIKSDLNLQNLMLEIRSIAFEEVNDYDKDTNIRALMTLSEELNAKFFVYPRGGSEIMLSRFRFRCPAQVAIMEYPYDHRNTHFLFFKEENLHECESSSINEVTSGMYMELIERLIEISKKQPNVREIIRNTDKLLNKYEEFGLSWFAKVKEIIDHDILNLCSPRKKGKKPKILLKKSVDKIVIEGPKKRPKMKAERNSINLEGEFGSGPAPILNLVDLLNQNKEKNETKDMLLMSANLDLSSERKSINNSTFNQGHDKSVVDYEKFQSNSIKEMNNPQKIQNTNEEKQVYRPNERESGLYHQNARPQSTYNQPISLKSEDSKTSGIEKSKRGFEESKEPAPVNKRKRGLTPGNTPSKFKDPDFFTSAPKPKPNQKPITFYPPPLVLAQPLSAVNSSNFSDQSPSKKISDDSSKLISTHRINANLHQTGIPPPSISPAVSEPFTPTPPISSSAISPPQPLYRTTNSLANPNENSLLFPEDQGDMPQNSFDPQPVKTSEQNFSDYHEGKLQPPQLFVNQNPVLIKKPEIIESLPKLVIKKTELTQIPAENTKEVPSVLDQMEPINKLPQLEIFMQNSLSNPSQPTSKLNLSPPRLLPSSNQKLPHGASISPEISQNLSLQSSMSPAPDHLNPPQFPIKKADLPSTPVLVPVNQPQPLPNTPSLTIPPSLLASNLPQLDSKKPEPPSIPSLVPVNQFQKNPNPFPNLIGLPQLQQNPQLFPINPPQTPPLGSNRDEFSTNTQSPLVFPPPIVPKLPLAPNPTEALSNAYSPTINPPQLVPVNPPPLLKTAAQLSSNPPTFLASPPVLQMNPLPFQANPVEIVSNPPLSSVDQPELPSNSRPFFIDLKNCAPNVPPLQHNPPEPKASLQPPFISVPPKLYPGPIAPVNPLPPKLLVDSSLNQIEESQSLSAPKLLIPSGFTTDSQEKLVIPEPAIDGSRLILNTPSIISPYNQPSILAGNPEPPSLNNLPKNIRPKSVAVSTFQEPPVLNTNLDPSPDLYPNPPMAINHPPSNRHAVPVPWLEKPKLFEQPEYIPKDSALTSSNVINIRSLNPVIQQSPKPEIILKDPLGFLPSRPMLPNGLVQPALDPKYEYPQETFPEAEQEEILIGSLGYMNPMERFQQSYCEDCLSYGSGIDIHLPCQCINCSACIQSAMLTLECSKCLRKYSKSDLSYLSVYFY